MANKFHFYCLRHLFEHLFWLLSSSHAAFYIEKAWYVEAWAATTGLAPNIRELKLELLYAQAMLDNARDREPRSPALVTLLHELRHLAYSADDVLDELDYFRIQDTLDGTYHAKN